MSLWQKHCTLDLEISFSNQEISNILEGSMPLEKNLCVTKFPVWGKSNFYIWYSILNFHLRVQSGAKLAPLNWGGGGGGCLPELPCQNR